jgi:ketosteroid isomerase-like protein
VGKSHALVSFAFLFAVVLAPVRTSTSTLFAAQGPPATRPDAASEVERIERELVAAIAKTDLATYDRIVADDYVAYTVTGDESSKAEIMASYRAGTRRYQSLAISGVKVRIFGDAAVVTATTSGTRVEEGTAPVPNIVRYFRVYARRSGAWRAVMQMVTPLPAASRGR